MGKEEIWEVFLELKSRFVEDTDFSSPEFQGKKVVFFSFFNLFQTKLQEQLLFLLISCLGLPVSFHTELFSEEEKLQRRLFLKLSHSSFHFCVLSLMF